MNKQLTPEFLAYCAGFFDGEGCVCISVWNKQRQGTGLSVQMTQTKREILDIIQESFGGTIYVSREKRLNSADCYYLMLRSNIGLNFLKAIKPYAVVKKPQIDLAIAYREFKMQPKEISSTKTVNGLWKRKPEYIDMELEFVARCKELNRRGK